jgi:hypothetical protein
MNAHVFRSKSSKHDRSVSIPSSHCSYANEVTVRQCRVYFGALEAFSLVTGPGVITSGLDLIWQRALSHPGRSAKSFAGSRCGRVWCRNVKPRPKQRHEANVSKPTALVQRNAGSPICKDNRMLPVTVTSTGNAKLHEVSENGYFFRTAFGISPLRVSPTRLQRPRSARRRELRIRSW